MLCIPIVIIMVNLLIPTTVEYYSVMKSNVENPQQMGNSTFWPDVYIRLQTRGCEASNQLVGLGL